MKVLRRIFLIYCIILSILLLSKFNFSINFIMDKIESVSLSRQQGAWNINLMPFRTIFSQLRNLKNIPTIIIKNLVGNIVIFVPYGFLLPMAYERMRKYHRTFLAGLFYILIIEFIQFVCMIGALDIDDMILNSMGVFCGFAIFEKILKKC